MWVTVLQAPSQQSAFVLHEPPMAWQPQVLLAELHKPPQQSLFCVQAPLGPEQPQMFVAGLQARPPQQGAPALAGAHVVDDVEIAFEAPQLAPHEAGPPERAATRSAPQCRRRSRGRL